LPLGKKQLGELPTVFLAPGILAACFKGGTTGVSRKAE